MFSFRKDYEVGSIVRLRKSEMRGEITHRSNTYTLNHGYLMLYTLKLENGETRKCWREDFRLVTSNVDRFHTIALGDVVESMRDGVVYGVVTQVFYTKRGKVSEIIIEDHTVDDVKITKVAVEEVAIVRKYEEVKSRNLSEEGVINPEPWRKVTLKRTWVVGSRAYTAGTVLSVRGVTCRGNGDGYQVFFTTKSQFITTQVYNEIFEEGEKMMNIEFFRNGLPAEEYAGESIEDLKRASELSVIMREYDERCESRAAAEQAEMVAEQASLPEFYVEEMRRMEASRALLIKENKELRKENEESRKEYVEKEYGVVVGRYLWNVAIEKPSWKSRMRLTEYEGAHEVEVITESNSVVEASITAEAMAKEMHAEARVTRIKYSRKINGMK